ncbi:5110_t:CDS:2, partial [Ambispora gerdemannii]
MHTLTISDQTDRTGPRPLRQRQLLSWTWNHFDQYNALKTVREVGISTAFDGLNPTYYYRKVAREERLPLSSWALLSNYSYILSENNYLFQ